MKVGFTGTQHGMTDAQKEMVHTLFFAVTPVELHHGDCIGADAEAHDIAIYFSSTDVVIHPPLIQTKRAFKTACEYRDPKPYLDRNHDIVDETKLLVATPKSAQEELRSGTWATIRYAVRKKKDVYIVFPDGSVETRHAGR